MNPEHIAILDSEQYNKLDFLAVQSGMSMQKLAKSAGAAVARCINLKFTKDQKILILSGAGMNGVDGLYCAACLKEEGRCVTVCLVEGAINKKYLDILDCDLIKGEIEQAYKNLDNIDKLIDSADIIVDAIIGVGLKGCLRRNIKELVNIVNDSRHSVVAIDLPTGVSGSSAQIVGTTAVKAQLTVTFVGYNIGHKVEPGLWYCGEVAVCPIGIGTDLIEQLNPKVFLNSPYYWLNSLEKTASDVHKYNRGHVLIVSGDKELCGSVRLAARAAQRCEIGAVTLACPQCSFDVHNSSFDSVIVRKFHKIEDIIDYASAKNISALVYGPGAGVGEKTCGQVFELFQGLEGKNIKMVLDADVLTSFVNSTESLARLISQYSGEVILTPHYGEMSHLIDNLDIKTFNMGKIGVCASVAQSFGAVIVYKGPSTIIAHPNGRIFINNSFSHNLATAGSGDSLCGIIAAMGTKSKDTLTAACAGVWLHSHAGEYGGAQLIADDISLYLPRAYKELDDYLLNRLYIS